ncbi:MAG: hypothetical protein ACREO1_11490 [Arenimonas sp.]
MKNIWLHSIVVVVLGSILIATIETLLLPVAHRMSASNPAEALASIGPPLVAFAKLAPALVVGWYTRRHPLLVGAAAGAFSSLLVNQYLHPYFTGFWLAGELVASGMIVAVAALAGRALRYRFTPALAQSHAESKAASMTQTDI